MEPGARVSARWSPGRCVTVELREAPATTEDPMTDDRMALVELLQKSGDGDFLRAVAEAVLQILMEADVEGLIGAGRHERTGDRLNYRNGYRDRSLDTRLGPLSLRIPKLRQGSYFPPFLEPRKTAGKALVMVIQEAWIGGVSTRRVDELVQAMGHVRSGCHCWYCALFAESCCWLRRFRSGCRCGMCGECRRDRSSTD